MAQTQAERATEAEQLSKLAKLARLDKQTRSPFPLVRVLDLIELLKKIEWEGDNTVFTCPACRRWKQYDHGAGCRLQWLLSELSYYEQRLLKAYTRRNVAKPATANGATRKLPKAPGGGNHNGRKRAVPRKRV